MITHTRYRDGFWFWELIITLQKQLLVGFLSLSYFQPGTPPPPALPRPQLVRLTTALCLAPPGTPLQLLLALIVCLVYLMLVAWFQPYRNSGLSFLAVIAATSLQFLFLAFLSFLLKEKYTIDLGCVAASQT